MNLLKRYEKRLNELKNKKSMIGKEIEWLTAVIDDLKKEAYQASRISKIRPKAESDEFKNLDTTEAAKIVLNEIFPNDMLQKDIAKEMFRRGWSCASKTPDQTVATALYRQKDKFFAKTGKGRYRLKEALILPDNGKMTDVEESDEDIHF